MKKPMVFLSLACLLSLGLALTLVSCSKDQSPSAPAVGSAEDLANWPSGPIATATPRSTPTPLSSFGGITPISQPTPLPTPTPVGPTPAPTACPAGTLRDNGDGTVTHCDSGVMWEQAPTNGSSNWCDAQAVCDGLVKAGYSDWRMASKAEWQALTGGTCEACGDWTLPDGHPFSNVQLWYWTSTVFSPAATCPGGSGYAWIVGLDYGQVYGHLDQNNVPPVWCVRG